MYFFYYLHNTFGESEGANLPVCRISRRGIDAYSSFLPRLGEADFMQLFPLRVSHAAEQSIPCFFAWRVNLWEPQLDFQLHLAISNKDA